MPPRADWAWSDVTAVRAVIYSDAGHEIIGESEGFDAAGSNVFLPLARRDGR